MAMGGQAASEFGRQSVSTVHQDRLESLGISRELELAFVLS